MTVIALLALAAWVWLALAHHRFWASAPELGDGHGHGEPPEVAVVVPARDEAETIAASLGSLLAQDYPGSLRIVLVDDGSIDRTAAIAEALAAQGGRHRLEVVTGTGTPVGWSGKLWAVAQGIARVSEDPSVTFFLLTDADIVHAPGHLAALVAKAEEGSLDLVSEMVALRSESLPERALVPAFVFFFQLLYPFAAVNDPASGIAAAAGGTMLLRRRALERIGGMGRIKGELIDDVALARAIKPEGRIWLGHARLARSERAYPTFLDLWRMIARTAFVELRFSVPLLLGTVIGMALLFAAPVVAALWGTGLARAAGIVAWVLAAALYLPTLHRYRSSPLWAPLLPLAGAFYLAATIGSAVAHWLGRGAVWKGRAYRGTP